MIFQLSPPYKSIEMQIWPFCKKLVEIETAMLYTKIQPQSFLGSGEEDF